MQTFLPYPEFTESARVLDYKRLGKQRVECLQILKTLQYGSKWSHHPAVLMWKGYELVLIRYGIEICKEWINRSYKDSCLSQIQDFEWYYQHQTFKFTPWLGNEDFHRSHRSNLLRKYPEHYRQFWPDEPDNLPYFWPTKEGF